MPWMSYEHTLPERGCALIGRVHSCTHLFHTAADQASVYVTKPSTGLTNAADSDDGKVIEFLAFCIF